MSRLLAIKSADVGDDETLGSAKQQASTTAAAQAHQVATAMLMTALRALSQRFIVALANLFTLLTAASAFYLWLQALPELNMLKIIGLSIYSVFVLALNIYGRHK